MVWKLFGMSRQGEKWNHFMVDLVRHHLLSKSWNCTISVFVIVFIGNGFSLMEPSFIFTSLMGPFILQPQFLQFEIWGLRNLVREIWFEKSGSRNLVREIWFEKSGWPEKKMILYHKSNFFQVREKWLTRKKNQSLQNHFSRTTFLHFSRKVVAE